MLKHKLTMTRGYVEIALYTLDNYPNILGFCADVQNIRLLLYDQISCIVVSCGALIYRKGCIKLGV